MSSERVDGIDLIRRAKLREPLRTPSWTPPLPPKPREEAPAEPQDPKQDAKGG